MEEKKLTEKESLELIASMISNTRKHLTRGEGNMLLFWGYLCVIVALLNFILTYIYVQYGMVSYIPISDKIIWWLIPIIGIPYTLIKNKKIANTRKVLTYTDKLSISLWNYVLWLAVATIIIGAIFFISGMSVWYVMFIFTFFVVGMAVSVQGMIIKEKSMIWGGAFSVLSGGFIVVGHLIGTYWLGMFNGIIFIISFVVMMIIPGYILNYKAKRE